MNNKDLESLCNQGVDAGAVFCGRAAKQFRDTTDSEFLAKSILSWEQADQIMQDQRAEIDKLKEAIRRLAAQDATLSVCDGNVTVTMDATLTAEEREAVEAAAWACGNCNGFGGDPTRPAIYKGNEIAATLRSLLQKLGGTNG